MSCFGHVEKRGRPSNVRIHQVFEPFKPRSISRGMRLASRCERFDKSSTHAAMGVIGFRNC